MCQITPRSEQILRNFFYLYRFLFAQKPFACYLRRPAPLCSVSFVQETPFSTLDSYRCLFFFPLFPFCCNLDGVLACIFFFPARAFIAVGIAWPKHPAVFDAGTLVPAFESGCDAGSFFFLLSTYHCYFFSFFLVPPHVGMRSPQILLQLVNVDISISRTLLHTFVLVRTLISLLFLV